MDDPHGPANAVAGYWQEHPWRAFGLWRPGSLGGRGPGPRMLFSGVWALYLAEMVVGAFRHGHSALYAAGVTTVTAVFAVVYIALVGWWDVRSRFTMPGFAILFAIALAASVVYRGQVSVLWIYVAIAAGMTINHHWLAMRIIAVVVGCYSYFRLSEHVGAGDFLSGLLPLVFGGLAALAVRGRFELTRELMRARETVALLAASEERLRLARDMHDLTGQSLSTITLKADLASRLLSGLPDSPERNRARDQVDQVADVSRQALRDVREALSGYRRPTLAVEAITARSAMEAAGITAHDDDALATVSGTIDQDAEAALAWCLREAVTNVVRHSGARGCWIGLGWPAGELSLEVRDDGHGIDGPGIDGHGGTGHGAGRGTGPDAQSAGHTGLHGMSERLSAVGGRLEIRPGKPGFCLVATVPVREAVSVGP
jgi:two-component system, NarL family, sensor histidine kinase DesK